ncbi:MAG: UvrD-helicase domain-containing protein [Proteobacteria bacterium]|nr:UvrD-helicase domain-containing protein [Pseudomonadota bacterium]
MPDFVSDHSEREQALSPEHSYIVQAPAGSGKTGLLIQRYLKLLSLVDSPEEIIAITFTRKAAAEMQSRILAALEGIASSEAETEYHKTIDDLAKKVLKRDEELGWQITENPERLQIQTIDSLCSSLTRQMPLMSRLGSLPETMEEPQSLYKQAAINTLAELESGKGWSDSIAALVLHLDNDLPRIRKLIMDMLAKRDQWLPYVMQKHNRNDMEESLKNLIEEELGIIEKRFPVEFSDDLVALINYAAKHLLQNNSDNPITCCIDLESLPTSTISDLQYWRGISELLLTKSGTWRKQFTVKNGFPPAGGNKLEEEERASRKKQILGLITELQKVDGLQDDLIKISQCPPANYTDAEWQIVQALSELLKLAALQLQLVFAERNKIDFIGIAQSAIMALGTDDDPTDLAATLDYQIKHILVDEYQDISVNQYRLLQSLTREWSLDDNRSLFLVGDPMQSIYRFREAEVGVFIKTFHEQCLGNVPLVPLRLKVNFRSEESIVRWINDSFQKILPENDDIVTGAVSFNETVANNKASTPNNVVVYPLYGRSDQKEASQTIEFIQELKNKYPDQRIAILVRSRSHLNEIIPALRKAGISFEAIDIEGLGTQPEIQDLLSLTRAYLQPADRIAWLSCLRAPWCGMTISSLYLFSNEHQDKTIWDCINNDNLIAQLEEKQRIRLEKFISVFKETINDRQRYPVRIAIESLWYRLGGPATLNNETEIENCESFFRLLGQLDQGGTIEDMQELDEQVKQLYAVPDKTDDNPVQIMTIHKAKGLEFDHVILPGVGRSPRSSQGELLVWLLRQRKQREELILAPIREAGNYQAAIYDYINNNDKHKQSFEDARLLYVATTRARHSLHILGHASIYENKGQVSCAPQKRSLLSHLWPVVKNRYEKSLPDDVNSEHNDSEIVINQETRRLSDEWNLPEAPSVVKWQNTISRELEQEQNNIEFEWAGETIKHIGLVVHNIIQVIAEEGINKWDHNRIISSRDWFDLSLKQLGVPDEKRPDAINQVVNALINMLDDKRGQWILSGKHKQQRNEYPVSGLYKNKLINVVLDRTFIDEEGIRWIIDYKTSPHEGPDIEAFLDQQQQRYQDQLEKYGGIMKQFGGEDIKLGLYFPLLQGWREWIYQ